LSTLELGATAGRHGQHSAHAGRVSKDAATAEADNVDRGIAVDVPTMIAVSTVAWALADVLHEVVGHGGAAALLGIPVRAVSTTIVFADGDLIQSMAAVRAIHASATVLNLVTSVQLSDRMATSSPSWER
jgi:hypothetical protein